MREEIACDVQPVTMLIKKKLQAQVFILSPQWRAKRFTLLQIRAQRAAPWGANLELN